MTVGEWVELLTKLLLLRILQMLLYRLVGLTTVLSLSLCGFSFWSITNSSCLGGGRGEKKVILCSLISDLSMSSTSSSNTNSGTNVFLLRESAVKGD